MKNQKGFTLIELLAVIVILVTISAIAIPSITASIERSKNKQKNAKIEVIEMAANDFYSRNKRYITSSLCYIELNQLDLTEKELENPFGGEFTGKVVYNNGTLNYTDEAVNISKCK